MKIKFLFFLILTLAAGCSFLPEREEPAEPAGLPESFSREESDRTFPVRWWEDFGSGELDRLVAEALRSSFTIRQAEARLRQAEASARSAGAGRYPQVDLAAEAGATRSRAEAGGEQITATSEDYALFLAAGYEIDLWGRVRSTYRQSDLLTAAAGEDLAAARITLAGEVADRWLREVELRSRLELARRQVETNRTYRELLLLRRRRGLATALAVFQQEQIVAATESLIPVLESELETVRHELAVLLGRPPRADLGLSA
ncbi:MAG: TolC family protein, partial [Candidatus Erginobacter occultus]|nr:TolC family protein [Candidatus Erginobacter occultus]